MVAHRLMISAMSNNIAAILCFDESHKEHNPILPEIEMLCTVSFGLNLFSIELSLKTTCLLYECDFEPTHNLFDLYEQVSGKIDGFEKQLNFALNNVNRRANLFGVEPISKEEIEETIYHHRQMYKNMRYLFVNDKGNLQSSVSVLRRDVQVVYYTAWALIKINENKMEQEGISLDIDKISEAEAEQMRNKEMARRRKLWLKKKSKLKTEMES